MASNQGVQVQIFGQVYHLRGGGDADHTVRVARLVDEKMNWIADRAATSDSYRVAVLAALDIADELVRLEDEHRSFRRRVNRTSDRLASLLDFDDEGPRGSREPLLSSGGQESVP